MPSVNATTTAHQVLYVHRVRGYVALRLFLEHVAAAAPHDDIPWTSAVEAIERGRPEQIVTLASRVVIINIVAEQEASPVVPEPVWLLLSTVARQSGNTCSRLTAALDNVWERAPGIRPAARLTVK